MHISTPKYWINNLYSLFHKIGFNDPEAFIYTYRISYPFIRKHINQFSTIQGWLSDKEGSILYMLAGLLQNSEKILVEIGVWKGKSTYCLAKGLESEGTLIVIDPFNASGEVGSSDAYSEHKGEKPLDAQFADNMKRLDVFSDIVVWDGYSSDFVDKLDNIDLLFIDGDHSIEGCKFDFLNYAPHLVSGGYLAFHDYDVTRDELGPTWVIKNKVLPSKQYKFIGLFGSVWVGKKV